MTSEGGQGDRTHGFKRQCRGDETIAWEQGVRAHSPAPLVLRTCDGAEGLRILASPKSDSLGTNPRRWVGSDLSRMLSSFTSPAREEVGCITQGQEE